MPATSTRIGYILKRFPRLSETFVLNEILEIERRGASVQAFSLHLPDDGRFHADLARLGRPVDYGSAEKADAIWPRLLQAGEPRLEGWQGAVNFLRRHKLRKGLDLLVRAAWIAHRVREDKIEHIHAHFATVSTQVANLVHLLTGVPFSFTAHAKDIFRDDVDEVLLTELGCNAAFVITVSDYNRKYMLQRYPGIPPEQIHKLYNGIDLGRMRPVERTTDSVSGGSKRIVSVGRLVPKKGFNYLLEALAACAKRGMELHTTIVGDGPERLNLEALRDRLGLQEQVEFTGPLSHDAVRDLGAQADCAVLAAVPDETGNADALPTVLLEALAQGVPIVSTRLTGIPEIVGEEGGLLVDPCDVSGLADALVEICRRIDAGQISPTNLRGRAERFFDLRTNAGALLNHMRAGRTVGAAQ